MTPKPDIYIAITEATRGKALENISCQRLTTLNLSSCGSKSTKLANIVSTYKELNTHSVKNELFCRGVHRVTDFDKFRVRVSKDEAPFCRGVHRVTDLEKFPVRVSFFFSFFLFKSFFLTDKTQQNNTNKINNIFFYYFSRYQSCVVTLSPHLPVKTDLDLRP